MYLQIDLYYVIIYIISPHSDKFFQDFMSFTNLCFGIDNALFVRQAAMHYYTKIHAY